MTQEDTNLHHQGINSCALCRPDSSTKFIIAGIFHLVFEHHLNLFCNTLSYRYDYSYYTMYLSVSEYFCSSYCLVYAVIYHCIKTISLSFTQLSNSEF